MDGDAVRRAVCAIKFRIELTSPRVIRLGAGTGRLQTDERNLRDGLPLIRHDAKTRNADYAEETREGSASQRGGNRRCQRSRGRNHRPITETTGLPVAPASIGAVTGTERRPLSLTVLT